MRRFRPSSLALVAVGAAYMASSMAAVAHAGGPYIAERAQSTAVPARLPSAAIKIGALDSGAPAAATSTVDRALPSVRHGVTPAGGVTIELDGRFMTHFSVAADGFGDGRSDGGEVGHRQPTARR